MEALAGVLIGAAIAFGTAYYFERRRENNATRHQMGQDATRLRRAVRLVWDDLGWITSALDQAVEARRWWSLPPRGFSLDVWRDTHGALAELMEDREWGSIRGAYERVRQINDLLDAPRQGVYRQDSGFGETLPFISPGNPNVPPAWARTLEAHKLRIEMALDTLTPYKLAELDLTPPQNIGQLNLTAQRTPEDPTHET